jgi:hypothetical protein
MSKQSNFLKLFYVLQENLIEKKRVTVGKMLTIIDACIADAEQRKGIKDLITHSYWASNELECKELHIVIGQFLSKFYPETILSVEENEFWEEVKNKKYPTKNYFPDDI